LLEPLHPKTAGMAVENPGFHPEAKPDVPHPFAGWTE